MIPISIVYSGFLIIILVIVYYSIKNINAFFEDITFGGGLEQKHYKVVVFIHIGIIIYSILILLLFNHNKTQFQYLSLKPFFINIFIAAAGLVVIFIFFHIQKFYVKKYLKNFYIDSYKDLQEDDEILNIATEYDEKTISKRYNKIIFSIVLQIMFVYFLMFLFPVAGLEKEYVPVNPGAGLNVSQNIVHAAKQRYGENYLLELAKVRRNYIKRHGMEKWNKYFGWQLQEENLEEADSKIELQELENEISNIAREVEEKALEKSEDLSIQNLFEELYEPIDYSDIFSNEEEELIKDEKDEMEDTSDFMQLYDENNPFKNLYE
jgi:hypothetical protein